MRLHPGGRAFAERFKVPGTAAGTGGTAPDVEAADEAAAGATGGITTEDAGRKAFWRSTARVVAPRAHGNAYIRDRSLTLRQDKSGLRRRIDL